MFCNKGFAHSQLGDYEKASESFVHAVQAGKDSGDKRCHWQACEGLAAVSFLQENHDKAVHFYKEALSVLSMSGAEEPHHHERIINKLADALECQFLATKKGKNGIRNSAVSQKDGGMRKKKGAHRVGKTRPRKEHHRLIARGIDGGEGVTSQGSSDSESSSSSGSGSSSYESSERGRKSSSARSIEVEVHQEPPSQRHHQKDKGGHRQARLSFRQRRGLPDSNVYEEPADGGIPGPSQPHRSEHYSPDMPRAHREAYLASVEAAKGSPRQEYHSDNNVTESKACVIQWWLSHVTLWS